MTVVNEDSSDTGSVSILDTACEYGRAGMSVFPVHFNPGASDDKAPMPGYLWQERASAVVAHIVDDFDLAIQTWGESNVSISWALGQDGYMAIDLDQPEEPEWWDAVDYAGITNITKRGVHLIFKNPPGMSPSNSTAQFPTRGWGDIRGAGGYIVVAGPDRPGFDAEQIAAAQPFPRPEWLSEYGGGALAVSSKGVTDFATAHNTSSDLQSERLKLNGIVGAIDKFMRDWKGESGNRHELCQWLLTTAAEESLKGYYPFKAAVVLIREWWIDVMKAEPQRHGREFEAMCRWAVGRALSKAPTAPNPTDDETQAETPDLSLVDDNRALIQFRELPDPFVLPVIEWHAKGLLMSGTHGELGGPEKSMKSYLALTTVVAIALGVPVLGHFEVPQRQRVLMLSGEGGEVGMLRRIERVVEGYGASVADLRPWLRYTTMTAPITSPLMLDSIKAAIDEFDPAIVWLDPWYAYAPGSAVASSALLTDIGQVLSAWRQAVGVERTAMINHHLNTGGTGDGLQRLAGAGHAEWCDSWMLVDHRERPNVEDGRFKLKLRIGSRQWGGGDYAVDLSLGRFDPEFGVHIGSIHWKVGRLAEAIAETDDERHQATMTEAQLAIKRYLRRQGRPVGRNELIEGVGGRKDRMRASLDILIERGEVIERSLKVAGGRGRPKVVCSLAEDQ